MSTNRINEIVANAYEYLDLAEARSRYGRCHTAGCKNRAATAHNLKKYGLCISCCKELIKNMGLVIVKRRKKCK